MFRSFLFSAAAAGLAMSTPLVTYLFAPIPVTAKEEHEGVVSCFDYYRFGSVQVDVQSQTPSTVSGVPLHFSGTITNENDYPIVDGAVYAKVFKVDPAQTKNTAGPDVVATFFVKKNISLPAAGVMPLEFAWDVPGYAVSGEYRLATFFTVADSFNLLGLPFTDDVIGPMADFSVQGEQKGTVSFDKAAVTLNGDAYHFAAYPPEWPRAQDVTLAAPVVNSTRETQTVHVTWHLYAWDSLREKNLVATEDHTITVKPNSTAMATYAVTDTQHPVYYAVGAVHYKDTTSIVGIRFVRQGIAKTRLNFPGVTAFPLEAGKEATLFSCLHGMGPEAVVPGGKLVLTLTDVAGATIHSYTYTGDVTGAMMGVRDTFVPEHDYDRFTLAAQLYQGDTLVDEAALLYSCEMLRPEACPAPATPPTDSIPGTKSAGTSLVGFVLISVAIAGGLTLWLRGRARHTAALLLFTAAALLTASPADAKSTQWTQTIGGELVEGNQPGLRGVRFGLLDPTVTITYAADILNLTTASLVQDNATIPVGTELRFRFKPHVYEHISWFGTGHAFDSPYGDWVTEARAPTPVLPGDHPIRPRNTCDPKDFLQRIVEADNGSFDAYVPLAVNPPVKTLQGIDGLDCGPLSGTFMDCTVTQPGTTTAVFNFGPTYGKFYYRLLEKLLGGATTCYGANTPLFATTGEFVLQVPTRTIPFTFTATATTPDPAPPNTPMIDGPTTGLINETHDFTVKGTDPAQAQLQYGVDWTGDGVVDQWVPSTTTFVAPNTPQPFSRLWTVIGPKPFRAKARNTFGLESGWATHTITLSAPLPSPTVTNLCTPLTQTVSVGAQASLQHAGAGAATWSAPGGTPNGGVSLATFTTTYATPGTYTVSVVPPFFYDVTGDGSITVDDANAVSQNLGATTGPGTGAVWQNQINRFDVNGDRFVVPQDRNVIITYLNNNGAGPLPGLTCQVQAVIADATPSPTPAPTVSPTPAISPSPTLSATPQPSGGPFIPGPVREDE